MSSLCHNSHHITYSVNLSTSHIHQSNTANMNASYWQSDIQFTLLNSFLNIHISTFTFSVVTAVVMSEQSDHITRSWMQNIDRQTSASSSSQLLNTSVITSRHEDESQTVILFVSSDDCSLNVIAQSHQSIMLKSEQLFMSLSKALFWIWRLLTADQYSQLEKLNMTLKHRQMNILDVQSDIVNHIIKERLWQNHIEKQAFHEVWDNIVQKTQQHQMQQNKICTAVSIIQQYWETNMWNRYFESRQYTYAKDEKIQKLVKECCE